MVPMLFQPPPAAHYMRHPTAPAGPEPPPPAPPSVLVAEFVPLPPPKPVTVSIILVVQTTILVWALALVVAGCVQTYFGQTLLAHPPMIMICMCLIPQVAASSLRQLIHRTVVKTLTKM
jgi:hypothetical protein